MPLYTGRVYDGLMHKEKGLIRYLTISRLTDNSGKKLDERLCKVDEYDLFDVWYPHVAPSGEDVNKLYKGLLNWKDFSNRYVSKINNAEDLPFLRELTNIVVKTDLAPDIREALETNLAPDNKKGIIIQCVCQDFRHCHRRLLAEEIAKLVKDRHRYDIKIIHLQSPI